MNKFFRRFAALALALVLTAGSADTFAAGYSAREAYLHFARTKGEFVLNVLENGFGSVSESTILSFMISVQRNFYYHNRIEPITEENFEAAFVEWVKTVSNYSQYADLQNAIHQAYPEAASALMDGEIHPSILPLFEELRDMTLNRGLLERPEPMENTDFSLLQVQKPEPLSLTQLDSDFPDRVSALSESGLWVELPLSWDYTPDTSFTGPGLARGHISLTDGYNVADGLDEGVELEVMVTPLSASGSCGSVSWTLENSVLSFSGGQIPDFAAEDEVPWAAVRDAVHKLDLEDVTSVGKNAFAGLKNLASRSVTLPASVTSVGEDAFSGSALDSVRLLGEPEFIGSGAFEEGTTLYGGGEDGAAAAYADENGLRFVPDGWAEPEIVGLYIEDSVITVDGMNVPGLKLAVYGEDGGLLAVIPAPSGQAALNVPDARFVRAMCWDWGTLRPLCPGRSLRLDA